MTIDLSKVKAGCKVKLRCGKELEVSSVDKNYLVAFKYHGVLYRPLSYNKNGSFALCQTPFDIVEIIEPPFNWDDVVSGMCFVDQYGDERWYIGADFSCDKYVVCSINNRCSDILSLRKDGLTRCPEGDIK